MSLQLRSPRDFVAGAIFLAFGLIGIIVGSDYEMGTAARMGPGYFPVMLSVGLLFFGLVLTVRGLMVQGEEIETASLRPLIAVLSSVALFGLTLERFGLIVAVPLVALMMAFATPRRRWLEVGISALVMSLFCVVVFVYGLGQQLRIWNF